MRVLPALALGAVAALGLLTACPGPPGMPKVPPPEYEDEPPGPASASASASASATRAGTVGARGACAGNADCAAGLTCACLSPGPPCPPDARCAACGARICLDPTQVPPPMPSPPPPAGP